MADALYYERPALLDRDKHRHCRVAPSASFGFARHANALVLAGVEFAEASKEYAIVFSPGAGGAIRPVAMLGLRARENLFVDAQGRWAGRYVPAFLRRYPFVLAELPGGSLGVCIDEAFPGLGREAGEPLFDAQGQDTAFLRNAVEFLTQYQHEAVRTEAFCRRLHEAGVLVEMDARADLVDGRSFSVAGLLVVDEQRLQALPDAQALSLFRAGEMHLVSLHLASLSNMQRLVDRLAERPPLPMAPPPRPQPA